VWDEVLFLGVLRKRKERISAPELGVVMADTRRWHCKKSRERRVDSSWGEDRRRCPDTASPAPGLVGEGERRYCWGGKMNSIVGEDGSITAAIASHR